jgi:hypothetical protein
MVSRCLVMAAATMAWGLFGFCLKQAKLNSRWPKLGRPLWTACTRPPKPLGARDSSQRAAAGRGCNVAVVDRSTWLWLGSKCFRPMQPIVDVQIRRVRSVSPSSPRRRNAGNASIILPRILLVRRGMQAGLRRGSSIRRSPSPSSRNGKRSGHGGAWTHADIYRLPAAGHEAHFLPVYLASSSPPLNTPPGRAGGQCYFIRRRTQLRPSPSIGLRVGSLASPRAIFSVMALIPSLNVLAEVI